jgi:predicted DCC family thiol-disulfide oxidoreductase YuxK
MAGARNSLTGNAIVLFDGHCNLCTWAVRFILPRDPNGHFRFASLQDPKADRLFAERNLNRPETDSILLLEGGRLYERSTAALRIARKLRRGWPLIYAFIIIPRFLRDPIYDWIAQNRYRLWGRRESCLVMVEGWEDRFEVGIMNNE